MKAKSGRQAYWNWALLSAFFSYQYLLRIYPGIFIEDIRLNFRMSAPEFAKLSTYCMHTYSLLQIPAGLLLDYVRIRPVVLVSLGLCLLGNFVLLNTTSPTSAQWSRILVGVGSACAFIGALKTASDHFPPRQKGILMGVTLVVGEMTVVLGSIAMAHVAQKGGWRTAVSGLQYVGYLLLGLCLWKFLRIPTKPLGKKISSHKTPLFRLLWDVVSNRRIFLYGLLSIGAYSSVAALSDLWGVGFLTIKFHLTKLQATSSNTMIFVGFGIGSLFFPWICGHGKRILRGIRYGSLGMAVLFAFIMYGPIVSTACVQGILFSLGFLSSVEVLCFILANQRSRPETSGLINGWVNTFNMMGAAFIQQVMGRHIDLQWKGLLSPEGIKIYQVSEYVGALLIPLGVIVGCTVVAVGMRAEHHSLQPSSFHDE